MKIKLSKSQWEKMGEKAGWMKTAQLSQLSQSKIILVNGDNEPTKFDFDSIKNEVENGNGTVYTSDEIHRFSISMEEDRQSVSVGDDKTSVSLDFKYPEQIDMAVKKFISLVIREERAKKSKI